MLYITENSFMKKISNYKKLLNKWEGMKRIHKDLIMVVLFSVIILSLTLLSLRFSGDKKPLDTFIAFTISNGFTLFLPLMLFLSFAIFAVNWRFAGRDTWLWRKIGYVLLFLTSTILYISVVSKAITVHMNEVERHRLNIEYQDKMASLKDSLHRKFVRDIKVAQKPINELREQIKDLNQTIDSFTTATSVLTAAKTDLKKQLTLAKTDGAIANEKAEAIKASFDSIAKRPIVSVDTAGVKSVPYDTVLILGLLIIISLVSSRFFKGFTMVPVKARRVYIPLVLMGVMLVLCFPYLQSLVWSPSEKKIPQEEVVVQSPKDSIAPEPQKKKEISVVEIKEKEKTPSVAPTISVGRTKVVRRKIIPRYCPPKNGGGKMKLYNTKPPL